MMDLKNPDPARPGAEPGAPHERRGRAPQQFQRADPQVPRAGLRGVWPTDRPPLRSGHANTRPRTRTRCSSRSVARRKTSKRPAITCANSALAKVGSIHVNVIRPFPEAAIINALRGKKNVIILERTDEGLAGDNPLARDIRDCARQGASKRSSFGGELPALTPEETPRLFRGAYGIGSRDFRPEHTLGAYEFAIGQTRRKDGKGAADGETYFVLGVDHPYAVISQGHAVAACRKRPIAVRFHSIGGWGMITTGKNLGSIIGDFGSLISEQNPQLRRRRPAGGKALRHGQSEVRLGEKRRADQLLPDRRAGADPGELRAEPRGRGAVLRSEGVHAHQPARRA